uniref:Putative secreted peptide n=1 Tax=Anopheles braziliensis TaxID=58242 RepID=A0A2M3ZML3_9DIPT
MDRCLVVMLRSATAVLCDVCRRKKPHTNALPAELDFSAAADVWGSFEPVVQTRTLLELKASHVLRSRGNHYFPGRSRLRAGQRGPSSVFGQPTRTKHITARKSPLLPLPLIRSLGASVKVS